jgi:hypothetical protein
MLYDYGTLEMWAATSPEWTATSSEDIPAAATTDTQVSESEPSMGIVTLGVVLSLLLVGIGTLAWGTSRVLEGSVSLNQRPIAIQAVSWTQLN